MDALTLIKTRHSTRKFSDKPVEKEKLEQVIEAGRFAPSGGNNQTTHFIVIQDKSVLSELVRITREEFAKMNLKPDTYASLATSIKLSTGHAGRGDGLCQYGAGVSRFTGRAASKTDCGTERKSRNVCRGGIIMNLYIWRHNKTYHSHSMINEPCVVNEFYLDALAIVEAETLDDALKLLEERKEGWRVEDLRELEPIVVPLTGAKVIYTHIRGSIDHL